MVSKDASPSLFSSRLYKSSEKVCVEDLATLCSRRASRKEYPLADRIEANIPIYHSLPVYSSTTERLRSLIQDEFYRILHSGPGVFVVRSLYKDTALIDNVNDTFAEIIEHEKSSSRGDHFSASGGNQRIWNSFSKHALHSPKSFATYYSNPWLALICESWLGPAYRITAQVNIVKPGGQPQVCHRDYHLGFQTKDACAKYPRAMQTASQFLTLQGAIAHSDMPLESGPTRLLPYSQLYEPGYMAYRQAEFIDYFDKSWVSAPLRKGDGIFFNPALFHAAGENKTESHNRSANLLQISSAFGKPMETIDTLPLIEKCWDLLLEMYSNNTKAPNDTSPNENQATDYHALVCAIAEGYPFPTNLDRRVPRYGGLAPESEQEMLLRCLKTHESKEHVIQMLQKMRNDAQA